MLFRSGDDDSLTLEDYATEGVDNVAGLAVGIMGDVPRLNDLTTVDEFPWRDQRVNQLYSNAKGRRCDLLIPGVPTKSGLTVRPGRATTIGRLPAISISLEVDEAARAQMPSVTRSQTDSYLERHRLAIEPIVYHDERDRVYFGTDCRAAFFEKDRPLITTKAEPMIGESVGRFVALGLLKSGDEVDGRTLLMSFRYNKSDELMTDVAAAKTLTECLILHLRPDATPKRPVFDVFSTTDGRQQLHRLRPSSNVLTDPATTINATIRFDKFVMMGLYPASPVVTRIDLSAEETISSAKLRLLLSQGPIEERPSFQDALDRFSEFVADDSIDARLYSTP